MTKEDDRRLIEDFLPIQAISAEASREKSVRKGHISTLHLWWARRPLVACRAAVYGALVPADQFQPRNGPEEKRPSLGRANAAKFITSLCKYPGDPKVLAEARRHILEAHAQRLTAERGAGAPPVTAEDILAGRAPRPKVLDMFAGGGAIPLEALRLGCDAYALDLNPVAHIIELCTLVYPQKYGKPDPNARGMTGPKNGKGDTTWGGLAEEVRYWGDWVLKKVKAEIGDLYPPIPDPRLAAARRTLTDKQFKIGAKGFAPPGQQELHADIPQGYLTPVAYLWTRTVTCKNPNCKATVPLLRQTWLCKKKGRNVALRMIAPRGEKCVRFEVVEAATEKGLGFDPSTGSKGGNATCPFCGTVADSGHVKSEGMAGRLSAHQLMAIVCTRAGIKGKTYLSAHDVPDFVPDDSASRQRTEALCARTGLSTPREKIEARMTGGICLPYGLTDMGKLFSPRQMLCLLTFAAAIRPAHAEMGQIGYEGERAKAVLTYLGAAVDRESEDSSALCRWNPNAEKMQGAFGRQALAMVWDFCETSPFGGSVGDWGSIVDLQVNAVEGAMTCGQIPGRPERGSAMSLAWQGDLFDALITDPPYYDNVDYAKLSDYFYVWLKRTVGHLYPEHFAAEGTPKKGEAVADPVRHGGSRGKARRGYEEMMAQAFSEAHRVLKPGGQLVVVYAHKTTLGWATLVDALRGAGFTVGEAWPLDTELKSRLVAMESAALASSILLVARRRSEDAIGRYEDEVRPELEGIVRERVKTLWEMEVSGADLVIACVGAGLRAFTRFASVEYANGESVPAERFLAEVETAVLESILARLSKEVGGNGGSYSLAGVDPATRFYILWRYTYRTADLDAGEAIIFANGTHVELDGQGSLSHGTRPLIEKKKGQYRLLDYAERGRDEKLGLPAETGNRLLWFDALHRTLWLMENGPSQLDGFLRQAQPNLEQMRLVAQALAGPALKGGELPDLSPAAEVGALGILFRNWQSVVGGAMPLFRPGKGEPE